MTRLKNEQSLLDMIDIVHNTSLLLNTMELSILKMFYGEMIIGTIYNIGKSLTRKKQKHQKQMTLKFFISLSTKSLKTLTTH